VDLLDRNLLVSDTSHIKKFVKGISPKMVFLAYGHGFESHWRRSTMDNGTQLSLCAIVERKTPQTSISAIEAA
jgi:hypothetical protein